MRRRRFYFLEPSKVGSQHITMIEGYLRALISSPSIVQTFDLFLCASSCTLASLPSMLISRFQCRRVLVMNPERRRLIRKSLLELVVVLRWLVKLREGDILLVSCMLPPALWLLEFANRLFRRRGVHVVLHDELEGLFAPSPPPFKAIGYWTERWVRSRTAESLIKLVVLDDFIRDKLLQRYSDKVSPNSIAVIHHPVLPMDAGIAANNTGHAACFIGYRTRFKGFEHFTQMAAEHPSVRHVAIGAGKVENVSSGGLQELGDQEAYLKEIAKCSVAVFPCTGGYSCTLSAAALDALSAGVHIIALDQPFFRSLASYFGPDVVTLRSVVKELGSELGDAALSSRRERRADRLERVARSKYGITAVRRSFENLTSGSGS